MKSVILALVAALLVAAQVLTPAAAAPSPAPSAAAACGDTYTVQRGDYLSKIARYCGVSLATIIAANPEISNINVIYPGQVIRLVKDSSIPVTGGSKYTVQPGDTLFLIAVRFGTSVATLLKLNPSITNASIIYVGQVITLPAGTTVPTTPSTSGARVSLSTRSAKAGGTVTVTVAGFPANASIDLRVGRSGQVYSTVVDATTSASGAATVKVTIPSSATTGQLWVVRVVTTEIAKATDVTSATITILAP